MAEGIVHCVNYQRHTVIVGWVGAEDMVLFGIFSQKLSIEKEQLIKKNDH